MNRIKKSGIVFVIIFLFLCIGWQWIAISYRQTIPIKVTKETGNDFSWQGDQEDDIKNAQFGCLFGSPFIYAVKRKTILEEEINSQYDITLNLIDLERGVRILQANWRNENSMSGCSAYTVSQAFAIQNQPYITLSGYQCDLPFYFRFLSKSSFMAQIQINLQKYSKNQQFYLDASGQLSTNTQIPFFMFPPLPGCTTFPGIDASKQDLAEYQVTPNGDCIQTTVWKNAGMPSSCFPLQDGSYFGHVIKKDTWTFFLRSDPPTFRDFAPNEIAAIRPIPSNTPENPSLYLLVWQANQSCLLTDVASASRFPANPNALFPIYEIQINQIAKGSPNDIFKVIGDSMGKYPLAVMHGNTALILYNQPTRPSKQFNPVSLSIVMRESHPDGSLGSFGSDIKEFPVKGMIDPQVLDSERLIFIRDHALWTVQWDGSGEKQVFPRK